MTISFNFMHSSSVSAASVTDSNDEIDLLDILVTIAQHIKLLIFLPLLVAGTGFFIGNNLTKTYESISILDAEKPGIRTAPSVIANFAISANLLDKVALELGIETDASKAARLKKVAAMVSATAGRQDKLVTLRTFGQTPEQAQLLNKTIWKYLLPLTAPRGNEMQRLQDILKAEQARLTEGNALEQATAQQLQSGRASENTARLYGELLASNSERMRTIATLQAQLEGLTADDLMQTPTLPEQALKPKPLQIAAITGLGTAMLLLLYIFIRYALQNASQHPEQADKVARLRAAFTFKKQR